MLSNVREGEQEEKRRKKQEIIRNSKRVGQTLNT